MIREFIDNLGGRKFIFGIILMILLGAMFISKVETETIKAFFNYAVMIYGLYISGNVVQKFSEQNEEDVTGTNNEQ